MSNRGELWVHGSSVVVQYPGGAGLLQHTPGHQMLNVVDAADPNRRVPWSDLLGARWSNGATFRGAGGTPNNENTNWFHFSIPTPAVFPRLDVREHSGITVDRVSVYYKTPDHKILIFGIGVGDGEIVRWVPHIEDSQNLHGDHTVLEDQYNSWLIDPITIRLGTAHGVSISVGVRFETEGEITFKAAAIHYQVGP